MRDKRFIKAAGVLITFFLTGMLNTVLATVTPLMNTQGGVPLLHMGLAVSVMSASRLIAVIPAGHLADKKSKSGILQIGIALIFAGALVAGFAPYGFLFYLAMVLFGTGHAFMDGAANALITDLYPEKPGGVLNLLHMFFGIGGMLGPLAFGFLIKQYSNWQYPFLFIGVVAVLIGLFLSVNRYDKTITGISQGKSKTKAKNLLNPALLFLCLMMFIMIGSSNTFKSFVNTLFVYRFAVTAMYASTVLALTNGGVTFGRLLWSMFAEKIGYNRILALGMVGTLITGMGTLLSSTPLIGMIFAILTGVFMSPFFPISIAIGGMVHPEKKGTLTGLFTVCASLGSMIFPAICGYLADQSGNIKNAMFILPLSSIIPIILFLTKARKQLAIQMKDSSNLD
ncbi:MAG TPA: hypothetical protein DDZ89_11900 [Clostridiales bacterium]|nr:hypothetical protein [Clostridiales bacterium]